jgi:hypothetical protein
LIRSEDRGAQIRARVHVVQLRGLEQAVERRRDLRAAARFRSVVIAATDDGTSKPALGGVVVEGDPRIVDDAREPIPIRDRVRRRFAVTAARTPSLTAVA